MFPAIVAEQLAARGDGGFPGHAPASNRPAASATARACAISSEGAAVQIGVQIGQRFAEIVQVAAVFDMHVQQPPDRLQQGVDQRGGFRAQALDQGCRGDRPVARTRSPRPGRPYRGWWRRRFPSGSGRGWRADAGDGWPLSSAGAAGAPSSFLPFGSGSGRPSLVADHALLHLQPQRHQLGEHVGQAGQVFRVGTRNTMRG